jgi:hypothetical protein
MRYRRGNFDCDQSIIKGTLLGPYVPFHLYLDGFIRTTAQMLKSDTTFSFSKDSCICWLQYSEKHGTLSNQSTSAMETSLQFSTIQKLICCNVENMSHLGHLTDDNKKHSIFNLKGSGL